MGLLSRLMGGAKGGGGGPLVDAGLPDEAWYAASVAAYERTISSYYGSPETMAGGGFERQRAGDAGVAMQFFRKSIDMLHTAYGFGGMEGRQPSDADVPILDAFCSAVEQTLMTHPGAPVDDAVQEVTHRLRSIKTTCDRHGLASGRYQSALDRLGRVAPDVPLDHVRWN